MDGDLGTPAAMALLFDLVRRANANDDVAAGAAALAICEALGLQLNAGVGDIEERALQRARERDEARAGKDWATADAIRGPDLPMLQGLFLLFSAAVIVFNLIADITYSWLDPRVEDI